MVSECALRRVERFEKGLELLEEIANVEFEDYTDDLRLQSISERNLQVCIETIIDLANVIIAKKGLWDTRGKLWLVRLPVRCSTIRVVCGQRRKRNERTGSGTFAIAQRPDEQTLALLSTHLTSRNRC
jgi:hypothetical protein